MTALGEVREMPAGLYLCVCFNDMAPVDGFEAGVGYLRRFRDEAAARGLEPVGDCVDEILMTGIRHEDYCKLQVRVRHISEGV